MSVFFEVCLVSQWRQRLQSLYRQLSTSLGKAKSTVVTHNKGATLEQCPDAETLYSDTEIPKPG